MAGLKKIPVSHIVALNAQVLDRRNESVQTEDASHKDIVANNFSNLRSLNIQNQSRMMLLVLFFCH